MDDFHKLDTVMKRLDPTWQTCRDEEGTWPQPKMSVHPLTILEAT